MGDSHLYTTYSLLSCHQGANLYVEKQWLGSGIKEMGVEPRLWKWPAV